MLDSEERWPRGLRRRSRKAVSLFGIVGSNPTLSATILGEVLEWSNRRAWKARRGLKPLVGSNPTLSASFIRTCHPTCEAVGPVSRYSLETVSGDIVTISALC